jgi:phage FluMu protein Com
LFSIGSQIVDSDLKIIGNITKLEKLNISKTEITDHGLQYIYGLKKLICQDCMKISDSGIKMLINSSSKLELLDIRRCKQINKIYIREIATAVRNNRSNNVPLVVMV